MSTDARSLPQSQTANPEYTIGPMRVQTMRGCVYFHVSAQTTMSALDQTVGQVMPKLFEAQRAGKVASAGPIVFVYTGSDEASPCVTSPPFLLEMGFPVAAGTEPAGEAKVRRLEDFHCASLVYCGPLKHLGTAFGELGEAMKRAELKGGNELREWYLYFEDDGSPNNVTLLQHSLQPPAS